MKLKKILAVVSAMAMLTAFAPNENFNVLNDFSVSASAETLENGLIYEVNQDGTSITITGCDESITEIEIPAEIDGLPVTNISDWAFVHCTSLTSIIIPDFVTNIGDNAFIYCTSLTSITIPDSVKNIGNSAFKYCTSLISIKIPNSVTNIGNQAFYGCTSLTSIVVPDSIMSIGEYAFYETPFCNNQTTDIKYAGKWIIDCNKNVTEVEIKPGTVGIVSTAFWNCDSLTSITMPDSVVNIGTLAFGECDSLKEINIPNSVTYLGFGFAGYCIDGNTVSSPRFLEPWTINVSEYSSNYVKQENFTIYGYTGSITETYANVNGFNFVSIGTMPSEQPTVNADIDGDGETTTNDALDILNMITNPETLTEEKKTLADVNKDGELNSYDAFKILQMIVGLE